MTAISPTHHFAERDRSDPLSFLASHRALAACTRELTRLGDEIVAYVSKTAPVADGEKPEVRLSPGRFILQLGPVALTLAWLRSTPDSVAEGELLIIVWRGTVGTRRAHSPERPMQNGQQTASPAWEDVFIAVASNEASWVWRPKSVDLGGLTSPELAKHCAERLDIARRELSDAG